MSSSNSQGTPSPATQDDPYPLAPKLWMFIISAVVLGLLAWWGVSQVNSIPVVSKLPEGAESPMDYVLQEATAKFAVPVAILGLVGALFGVLALVVSKLKLWFEFFIKLFALCAIIYTSTLILVTAY